MQVVSDIPVMTAEDPGHNSARRFITLIDQVQYKFRLEGLAHVSSKFVPALGGLVWCLRCNVALAQMYESGTGILCSAAAIVPADLFDNGNADMDSEHMVGAEESEEPSEGAKLAGPALSDPAEMMLEYENSKLASVMELDFAFRRAASRLAQMTGTRQRAMRHS